MKGHFEGATEYGLIGGPERVVPEPGTLVCDNFGYRRYLLSLEDAVDFG
jgi:hypothetical protein